jgi:hypothetical protein
MGFRRLAKPALAPLWLLLLAAGVAAILIQAGRNFDDLPQPKVTGRNQARPKNTVPTNDEITVPKDGTGR